ncbi:DUF3383 family protein [Paenibacillus periandrae]|uniref:DUF3383 family protein n=1 Tax=Paenibacillus periandrae TaxID=1761741 RepID=UPI001F09E60B
MPISDVRVIIDLQKPAGLIGFGLPLILGTSTAGAAYKKYADLTAVAVDYIASTEEYKAAAALFGQGDNSPREIAIIARKTGSTAETLADALVRVLAADWYFLIAITNTVTDVVQIADAIEAEGKRMFFTRTSSKTDLATIQAEDYMRTAVFYHTTTTNYPEAAWVGDTGALPVGSATWKFRTLTGIQPMAIDATELNAIHALGAVTYVTKAGTNSTSEGVVVEGEYIDNVMAQDWVKVNIENSVQFLLNREDKIPYTDAGISLIEGAVRTVLQAGFTQGIIAGDEAGKPMYSTDFPTRGETTAADRAARVLTGGKFSFQLAGAIHSVDPIKGTISV